MYAAAFEMPFSNFSITQTTMRGVGLLRSEIQKKKKNVEQILWDQFAWFSFGQPNDDTWRLLELESIFFFIRLWFGVEGKIAQVSVELSALRPCAKRTRKTTRKSFSHTRAHTHTRIHTMCSWKTHTQRRQAAFFFNIFAFYYCLLTGTGRSWGLFYARNALF